MGQAGIYKITSMITGKVYIGQTHDFSRRFIRHKTDLKYHNHKNIYLQRHVNKYGLKDLIFDTLEELPSNHALLLEREIYWINLHKSNNYRKGFNLNEGGTGGYATNIKHKNFTLVNLKHGQSYFFKTLGEFENHTGLFKHKIREVLLKKERKTSLGWTTPEYFKQIIERKKVKEQKKEHKNNTPPLQIKPFKIKNSQTGKIIYDRNIKNFSQENNLCYNSILRVIRGERKKHKVWEYVST